MNKQSSSSSHRPLKLIKIGNSTGVVLPKELLARLRLELGDEIFASETPNGLQLSAYNADFAKKMEMAETIMQEDRDILHILSK